MSRALRALACAPLALATPARADGPPQDVVVTGQPAPPPPGGHDTVTAEDYRGSAAVSLRDALAFSPGVITQPRFGQEVRLSIRGSGIGRGFHMRGITLFQDGVPINTADGNGDFQELDPQVLSRIEVTRGANALALGAATLGGAIDGITPTGRDEPGLGLRADGGSFDTLRGLVSYGTATGRGDVFAALTADRGDGDRDHARREALRFNGNVGLRLSDTVETRLYAAAQTINQELPGTITRAAALARPRTANAAALAGDQARNIDSLRLQSRTTATLGDATIAVGGFVNAKKLDHPIFEVIDQQSTDGGFFARAYWQAGPFAATLGTIARFGSSRMRRFANVGGRRGRITFRAEQDARTVDAYGELRWSVLPALTLIGGADWTQGFRRQAIAFPAAATGDAAFRQLSPRIGLLATPLPDIGLYANYSRSHELPGFTELAQVSTFVPLDVQRGWTVEAGARGRRGIAAFDVVLYRSDLKGELLQFTVSPSIPAATFNAGRTRHQGIEASLDLAPARWLRLRQVYTLSDFTFRRDANYGDNRLPVIPRHFYRGELRLGSETLNLAPRLEWVPQGAWADYRNTVRSPSYVLLGATATAPLTRWASLFLDLRNATAKHAIGDVSAVVQATAASAIYYPVERRALYAGLRARF